MRAVSASVSHGAAVTALAVLSILLASSTALAQRRVALAPLEGGGARALERALEGELERRGYAVVRVTRAPEGDTDAAALVREAEADALIEGRATVVGSRRRRQLVAALSVRDASGAVHERVDMRVRAAQTQSVARRVASALDAAEAESPAPAPRPVEQGGAHRPPARAPRRSDRAGRARTPEVAPVRALVQVGAGARSRAIELLAPDGLDAAYRAEPYLELTVGAEVRLFDVGFVRARFGSAVGLTSRREDPSLGTVDTSFMWVSADAGASAVIDDTVELGGAFGVGWDRYELAFNELVPTAEYLHLRPALIASVRLVGRALVLDAEGGVRIPLGVGALESVHGREHDVIGADITTRLRGVIAPGFAWALEAGFRRYWLTFTRPDGVVTGSDGGWHTTAWAGWEI